MIVIYGNCSTDGERNLLDYLMSTCEIMEYMHEHPNYLPKRVSFHSCEIWASLFSYKLRASSKKQAGTWNKFMGQLI